MRYYKTENMVVFDSDISFSYNSLMQAERYLKSSQCAWIPSGFTSQPASEYGYSTLMSILDCLLFTELRQQFSTNMQSGDMSFKDRIKDARHQSMTL